MRNHGTCQKGSARNVTAKSVTARIATVKNVIGRTESWKCAIGNGGSEPCLEETLIDSMGCSRPIIYTDRNRRMLDNQTLATRATLGTLRHGRGKTLTTRDPMTLLLSTLDNPSTHLPLRRLTAAIFLIQTHRTNAIHP